MFNIHTIYFIAKFHSLTNLIGFSLLACFSFQLLTRQFDIVKLYMQLYLAYVRFNWIVYPHGYISSWLDIGFRMDTFYSLMTVAIFSFRSWVFKSTFSESLLLILRLSLEATNTTWVYWSNRRAPLLRLRLLRHSSTKLILRIAHTKLLILAHGLLWSKTTRCWCCSKCCSCLVLWCENGRNCFLI